jgi:hypothetical protein
MEISSDKSARPHFCNVPPHLNLLPSSVFRADQPGSGILRSHAVLPRVDR